MLFHDQSKGLMYRTCLLSNLYSQELWCGEEGPAAQIHGVFEHEEEVQMAHQVPNQFIDDTGGERRADKENFTTILQ